MGLGLWLLRTNKERKGGRKKDGRKAIEKMVTIKRLTKKIFQKNRRGVASTPPPCAGEG